MKKLYKSTRDRKVAGVCAGIAQYFNVDPTIVRLITVCAIIFAGFGLWAYIICAIVLPNEPAGGPPPTDDDINRNHYNN